MTLTEERAYRDLAAAVVLRAIEDIDDFVAYKYSLGRYVTPTQRAVYKTKRGRAVSAARFLYGSQTFDREFWYAWQIPQVRRHGRAWLFWKTEAQAA